MDSPNRAGSPWRITASAAAILLLAAAIGRADWEQVQPAASPSARAGACMAFDPVGGGVLLFGGDDGRNFLGDTWKWDGTTWTRLTPADSPSRRGYAAMTLDHSTGRLLLFGGRTGFRSGERDHLGDTWQWSGSTWVRLFPASSPSPRYSTAMASDPRRRRTVLLGGMYWPPWTSQATPLNDTWEWNGSDWAQIAVPDPKPTPRYGHALAYDPFRFRVVSMSGDALGDDFWNWDGVRWRSDSYVSGGPDVSPNARMGPGWVYDSNRGGLLLFGGLSISGAQPPYFFVSALQQAKDTVMERKYGA